MKTWLWVLLLLLPAAEVTAQVQAGHYNIWTIGTGLLFPTGAANSISTHFPYTVTSPPGGTPMAQTFDGTVDRGFFTGPFYLIRLSNFELVRKKHSIDLGLGLFEDEWLTGVHFQFGYRRVLPLGKLLLKPGVDCHLLFSARKSLGSVDNKNKEIQLFGLTAHPQYTVDEGGGDTYDPETVDAARLKIEYQRTGFLVEPKVVLATPPWRKLVFSLEAGWMLPLSQTCSLAFEQVDANGGNAYTVGHRNLQENGSFIGPYATFTAGIAW